MKNYKVSLLYYALTFYLLSFTVIIILFDKLSVFYFVNARNNQFLDLLFYYTTALGNGWFYTIVMLSMLMIRYRYALMFFSALVIKTIIVQSLKHLIFPDVLRPSRFFDNYEGFHSVPGVELLSYNSFPSGHSASIFCIAVFASLIVKNNILTVLFLIVAILSAYSRMYLAQHFSIDVYVGSIIGIIIAFFTYWLFIIKPSDKLNRIGWIDKKLTFAKAG